MRSLAARIPTDWVAFAFGSAVRCLQATEPCPRRPNDIDLIFVFPDDHRAQAGPLARGLRSEANCPVPTDIVALSASEASSTSFIREVGAVPLVVGPPAQP